MLSSKSHSFSPNQHNHTLISISSNHHQNFLLFIKLSYYQTLTSLNRQHQTLTLITHFISSTSQVQLKWKIIHDSNRENKIGLWTTSTNSHLSLSLNNLHYQLCITDGPISLLHRGSDIIKGVGGVCFRPLDLVSVQISISGKCLLSINLVGSSRMFGLLTSCYGSTSPPVLTIGGYYHHC